jgi:NAD-dependent dihydropyrimidine dehydrogenase PreA subunit
MIEVVSQERCIRCDVCIRVCPTNVFERGPEGYPVIQRQDDCQTCFMCEAWCPEDALFVAPLKEPAPVGSHYLDEPELVRRGLLGSYRRELGWGEDQEPSAGRDTTATVLAPLHGHGRPPRLR